MAEEVELRISYPAGGPGTPARSVALRGWERITVRRSVEQAAGALEVKVTDRDPWPIGPGALFQLYAGDDLVLRGWIDHVEPEISEQDRGMRIQGRTLTADLVDCAAIHEPGEWRDVRLHELARELAEPFEIPVVVNPEQPQRVPDNYFYGEPFDKFTLQPGETAWQAIERAARLRGFLAYPDARGALILSRPITVRAGRQAGGPGVTLREGENVKSAAARYRYQERFSQYLVVGQSFGTEDWNGEDAAAAGGEARDPELKRYRPLVILAEDAVTPAAAQVRAEWEASIRAARSLQISVNVQGWRPVPGLRELWEVNRAVPVEIPSLRLQTVLLISGLELEVSSQEGDYGGTTATLTLVRLDAYRPVPEIPEEGNPMEDGFIRNSTIPSRSDWLDSPDLAEP